VSWIDWSEREHNSEIKKGWGVMDAGGLSKKAFFFY
jgi:hypothetical protein